MAISLAVAFVGSVVAAVGTGVLTARCFRAPRADVIAITLAMLGLTVALGSLTLGILAGFGPTTFRAIELGGQVLAPLALCLALAEMAARTVPARFAARLLLSGLAVVEFVILSTDQLNPAVLFSKAWPAATVFYETIPNDLLRYGIAPVTALTALIAIGVTAVRLGRNPALRPAAAATGSAGAAALALAVPAAVTLPSGAVFAVLCLAAAVLAWFAAAQGSKLRRDLLNGSLADEDDGRWDDPQDSWAGHIDQTGDFDALAAGGAGVYRGSGLYRPDDDRPASDYRQHDDDYDYERDGRDAGYLGGRYGRDGLGGEYGGGQDDDADASYAANGRGRPAPDARYEEYGDDDHSEAIRAGDSGADSGARSGIWLSADRPGEPDHLAAAGIPAGDDEARARLFGQIAIYTLLEDRVGEFDVLTEQVVEQVQAREPDTLVYIVHAVPSAPMQRILYEVYRDRAAYDEHRRQPYVARFEMERRPYVLATNVIELGLQQAKVSPLPSISDLLGPSGPGSPGFLPPPPARPPASGRPGSSQPGHGQPGSSQPGSSQPGSSQPGHGQPGPDLSVYDEPGPGLAGYEERGRGGLSGYDEARNNDLSGHDVPRKSPPGYEEPGPGPSVLDEPRSGLSGYDKPARREPGYSPSGSSYDEPEYGEPGYSEPEYSDPGYAEPRYGGAAEPGYSPSGYSPSGYDRPRYAEPRHSEPGHSEPGHSEPGHAEPGHAEPGHDDADDAEPGYDHSRYEKTPYDEAPYDEVRYDEFRYGEPGHREPGHREPGDGEPGYPEQGYGEPGYDRPEQGGLAAREEGPQRQW